MMSLLARLPVADCEVVHTLLLRYEASHQRQEGMQRFAEGAVQADLARTYGVSQATSAGWRGRALSSTSRSACDAAISDVASCSTRAAP